MYYVGYTHLLYFGVVKNVDTLDRLISPRSCPRFSSQSSILVP